MDTVPVPVGACIAATQILLQLREEHPSVARQIEAALCPDGYEGAGLITDTITALEAVLLH